MDRHLIAQRLLGPRRSEVDPEKEWRFYISGLPNYLDSRIAGQSAAVGRIARAVQAAELGLNEIGNRPKCS
ncbi:MAG: hypothetical protein QOH78_2316, partial [Verrucomicrobiota bacterium]